MKGYIGGIALPTNVTKGKCIPSILCVVDVYLTMLNLMDTLTKRFTIIYLEFNILTCKEESIEL